MQAASRASCIRTLPREVPPDATRQGARRLTTAFFESLLLSSASASSCLVRCLISQVFSDGAACSRPCGPMFSAIPFVHQGLARTTPGDAIFVGVKREAGQTFLPPIHLSPGGHLKNRSTAYRRRRKRRRFAARFSHAADLSPRRACVFFHSRLRRQSYEASSKCKRWRQ
jgi:hypothetical protein